MRFEVPQFIEVEDKIFGPFTWKQFVYLAGAGGAGLVLFFALPFFLFIIFAGPIVGLGGFLAFHQVNNRPFSVFLESFVHYFAGTKLYLWRKREQQAIIAKTEQGAVPKTTYVPPTAAHNISSLSRKLEFDSLQPLE